MMEPYFLSVAAAAAQRLRQTEGFMEDVDKFHVCLRFVTGIHWE